MAHISVLAGLAREGRNLFADFSIKGGAVSYDRCHPTLRVRRLRWFARFLRKRARRRRIT